MHKNLRQWVAVLSAVTLFFTPAVIVSALLDNRPLHRALLVVLSFPFTMPILIKAWRYFHEPPQHHEQP